MVEPCRAVCVIGQVPFWKWCGLWPWCRFVESDEHPRGTRRTLMCRPRTGT